MSERLRVEALGDLERLMVARVQLLLHTNDPSRVEDAIMTEQQRIVDQVNLQTAYQ